MFLKRTGGIFRGGILKRRWLKEKAVSGDRHLKVLNLFPTPSPLVGLALLSASVTLK